MSVTYLRLINLSMLSAIHINDETFLMIDFMNLKIKLIQSFKKNS
jgi:hypothetical protein